MPEQCVCLFAYTRTLCLSDWLYQNTDLNFKDNENEDPAQYTVEEIMKFYESDQYDSTMNVGKDVLEILDVEDNADSNDDKLEENVKRKNTWKWSSNEYKETEN